MADVIAEYFVKTLAEAPGLATVEGRVYTGMPPVGLSDLVYPLIIFFRAGGLRDRAVPFERFAASVEFVSSVSLGEARQLYETAKSLLDKTYKTSDGRSFVVSEAAAPSDDTGTVPIPTYVLAARYLVRILG